LFAELIDIFKNSIPTRRFSQRRILSLITPTENAIDIALVWGRKRRREKKKANQKDDAEGHPTEHEQD
jgi:hypothetical protein